MRALVLVHRWLGVAFCLPVAMWFATGIVMLCACGLMFSVTATVIALRRIRIVSSVYRD